MSEMMKRRTFLKTAGAVVAAVALAACDGDTPAPAPATPAKPSTSQDKKNLGKISVDMITFSCKKSQLGSTKGITSWGADVSLIASEAVTISKDNFKMTYDGKELEILGFWDREKSAANSTTKETSFTVSDRSFDLKASEKITVNPYFRIDEETYKTGATSPAVKVTVLCDDKSYSVSGGIPKGI